MRRRSVLAGIGASLSIPLAGCSALDFIADDEQRQYSIGVYNYSDEDHTFIVRIGPRPAQAFENMTVELDASTADERILFDGIPATLHITVSEEYEREFPWPVEYGGSEQSARKANIYFNPGREQPIWVHAG